MNIEKKKHAKFPPSSAHRWLKCAGSIREIEKAPTPPESPYAKEGTDAHEVLEQLGKNPHRFLQVGRELQAKYGIQMVAHAEWALQEMAKRRPHGANLLMEEKVSLAFIHPDLFGTCDISLLEDFGSLEIYDYKYGAGLAVEILEGGELNAQLAAYLLGQAHKYGFDFETFRAGIIQPRVDHPDGKIRIAEVTRKDLHFWEDRFKRGIDAALKPNAKLVAGDHCRFCPAAVTCPALSTQSLKQAQVDFDDGKIAAPKVTDLTPLGIGQTLTALKWLDLWAGEVRKHAYHQLINGGKIPGWKLVDKRGTRKWRKIEDAEKLARSKFGDKAFTKPELLSPAQMEKQVGKTALEFVSQNTESISSGLTLAESDDARAAHDQLALDFGLNVE